MSAHTTTAAPLPRKFFTRGVFGLMAIMAAGAGVAAIRLIFGLSATTNLNNQYPWGIWIALDVATGVALAAGGFTTAALAHIFGRHRYEPLVRPALLTALLGYTFVVLGLLMDLGRYYNVWHPAWPTMWQGNSVLFEVGMCVMVYLHVLYFEFAPIVCERFVGRVALPGPLSRLNGLVDGVLRLAQTLLGKVMFLFIIAGVVLSCMHQSSLGALMLIAPYKVHPLWYTPILPLLFLLSAMAVGFPMVIFESILASWLFKRKPEMHLLSSLSRLILIFLGVYGAAKISDMMIRGSYVHLLSGGTVRYAFMAEIGLGVALPFALLLFDRVRRSPRWLFTACSLVIGGVALNRVNVFLVAYNPPYAAHRYFPSASEMMITVSLIAALVFVYRVVVTIFPVLPLEHEAETCEVEVPDEGPLATESEPYALS